MSIQLTEDYALQLGVSLTSLIEEKQREGFRIIHKYQHPAVGTVIVMEQYSLAS
jgi:hypothetical protein